MVVVTPRVEGGRLFVKEVSYTRLLDKWTVIGRTNRPILGSPETITHDVTAHVKHRYGDHGGRIPWMIVWSRNG